MTNEAQGVSRLHIPAYQWGSEGLHGAVLRLLLILTNPNWRVGLVCFEGGLFLQPLHARISFCHLSFTPSSLPPSLLLQDRSSRACATTLTSARARPRSRRRRPWEPLSTPHSTGWSVTTTALRPGPSTTSGTTRRRTDVRGAGDRRADTLRTSPARPTQPPRAGRSLRLAIPAAVVWLSSFDPLSNVAVPLPRTTLNPPPYLPPSHPPSLPRRMRHVRVTPDP